MLHETYIYHYPSYCRARGYNTLYICGTDEYGTATETKALEEGVSCRALCDKYNAIHSNVYKWFQLSFDHFGRTTTDEQTEIAQDIFNKVHANGFTSEAVMTQLFCEKCQRYAYMPSTSIRMIINTPIDSWLIVMSKVFVPTASTM